MGIDDMLDDAQDAVARVVGSLLPGPSKGTYECSECGAELDLEESECIECGAEL